MFSCWSYCGNEDQDQNQIIVKGFDGLNDTMKDTKVDRKNKSRMKQLMGEAVNVTLVKASNYGQCLEQCRKNKTNFVDPFFPPNSTSLNFSMGNRKIIWKRIVQVIEDPLIVEGTIEPADIQQGNVGDCYFLAAISSIAQRPQRIKMIFDNQMDQVSKEGIYKVIICQQGEPKQLIIDDYIPVFEGSNRPVFCKPNNRQIWVMLLEKAWAKLSGSYGDTSSGYPHEVLNTFLLAPCFYDDIPVQLINSEPQKQQLWKKLIDAEAKNLPMCAGSRSNHICKGIKPSHTYSLLACYDVRNRKDDSITKILKLRNPWGDTEYTGRHSETDGQFWSRVDEAQKQSIFRRRNEDDGIFTMQLDQFIRNFESLDISHDRKQRFNYVYEKARVKSMTESFFEIEVEGSGECYITVEKGFNRHSHLLGLKEKTTEYGYLRLMLLRKIQSQQNQYEYVTSKLEPNFPDVSIYQKHLPRGRYLIATDTSFPEEATEGNLTISVYSQQKTDIEGVSKPDQHLFHKIFMDHAKNQNPNKKVVGSKNDWTASKLMYEEGGLGYLAAHLSKQSQVKLKIFCDLRKVYESGYKILERGDARGNQGQIEIDLDSERNDCILVFAVDFSRKKEQLKFPPKGVKVSRII